MFKIMAENVREIRLFVLFVIKLRFVQSKNRVKFKECPLVKCRHKKRMQYPTK